MADPKPDLRVAQGTLDRSTQWIDAPPTEAADDRVEQRYEPEVLLGKGGMGEVWRVRDRQLERTVAMKILRRPVGEGRFVLEARATAQLQHPGIVPIHELGTLADGRRYYTMQEVRGTPLSAVLAEVHAASWPDAWGAADGWTFLRLVEALRDACAIIAYAHDRGVLHRDLKPSNVMLGAHGEVWVVDWGLVKVLGAAPGNLERISWDPDGDTGSTGGHTAHGAVAGTRGFMSPEQARGAIDELTPASDVWSLGAVLYGLLFGLTRDDGPTAVDLQADMARVPASLAALCDRAMATDPGDRFADAGAMARALTDWLEGARRDERQRAQADRAETLLEGLDPADTVACRELLLSLVDAEGRSLPRPRTAVRPHLVAELLQAGVLEELDGALAIPPDLLDGWARLAGWIQGDPSGQRLRQRLAALTRAWDSAGRPPSLLLGGAALQELAAWSTARAPLLPDSEAAFLAASTTRLASQRQLRIRLVAGVIGVLLAATVVAVVQWARASRAQQEAWRAGQQERQARLRAEGRQLESDGRTMRSLGQDHAALAFELARLDRDPDLAHCAAARGHPVGCPGDADHLASTLGPLRLLHVDNRFMASPDGRWLLGAAEAPDQVLDAHSGLPVLPAPPDEAIALLEDALLVQPGAGPLRVRHLPDGAEMARLELDAPWSRLEVGPRGTLLVWRSDAVLWWRYGDGTSAEVRPAPPVVALGPDGHLLATADETALRVLALPALEVRMELPTRRDISAIEWSPDGRHLAVSFAEGQLVGLVDIARGRLGASLYKTLRGPGHSYAAFTDGLLLLPQSSGAVQAIDVETGEFVYDHNPMMGSIMRSLAAVEAPSVALATDLQGHLDLFDPRSPARLEGVAMAPHDVLHAVFLGGGAVQIKNTNRPQQPQGALWWPRSMEARSLAPCAPPWIRCAVVHERGNLLVAREPTPRILTPATGSEVPLAGPQREAVVDQLGDRIVEIHATELQLHRDGAPPRRVPLDGGSRELGRLAGLLPEGDGVFRVQSDGVHAWGLDGRHRWRVPIAETPDPGWGRHKPGDRYLALSVPARGGVVVHDLRDRGAVVHRGGAMYSALVAYEVHDNGVLAVGHDDGTATVWHLGDDAPLHRVGSGAPVNGVALDADAARLAFAHEDGVVEVANLVDGSLLRLDVGVPRPYSLAFGPAGQTLSLVADYREAQVWDLASGRRLLTVSRATRGQLADARILSDGSLVTVGVGGVLRWQLPAEPPDPWSVSNLRVCADDFRLVPVLPWSGPALKTPWAPEAACTDP